MARESSTSLDVARRAGVSQSAVSRAFTPGRSVAKPTAEKIFKAAKELGYRPNSLARAMVSGSSRIIGVVVAYLENQFYPEALEKLSAKLQAKGYHVMIFLSATTRSDIDEVMAEILDYQVDGIIAASVSLSSELSERCQANGVPFIFFNRFLENSSMTSVTSDNLAGGRKAAQFLIKGGHQRIAYIAGYEGASTQRDREAGFQQGLAEAGVTLFARAVGNFKSDEARLATLSLFDGKKGPDAIFVANDHMAFAVMDALRYDLGLSVPQDVSVIGYDDVPAAAWQSYDLTTIRQPADRMATTTIDILLAQIDGKASSGGNIKIEGPLICRGSARLPKEWDDEGL